MPDTHQVSQGEHLPMIASQYGFPDYTVIWNHPQNAELKDKRKNPNVLLEGDSVYIPDKEQRQEPAPTSQRKTFQLTIDPLMLNLVLTDIYDQPIANAPSTLWLDNQVLKKTTDGSGKLQQEITADLQSCTLSLTSTDTPVSGDSFSLMLGHLDPVDTPSGQLARLNNLGYPATKADPGDQDFQCALQEFQCDYNLPVTGDPGPETQAKLVEIHGC